MRASTIRSLFVFNTTLKPAWENPKDEDFALCKLIYYYPDSAPSYEMQSHVGLAEGLIMFTSQFSEHPLESIHTEKFTHVLFECEKNIWVSIVFEHQLYEGTEKPQDQEANSYNLKAIASRYYRNFHLFHGRLGDYVYPDDFPMLKGILQDYTSVFLQESMNREELFEGFYYCPIDRKTYMLVLFLCNQLALTQSQVAHSMIIYEGNLVTTTLPQQAAYTVYSYFSIGKQWRRLDALGRPPSPEGSQYGRALPFPRIGYLYGYNNEMLHSPLLHLIEGEQPMKLCCWVNQNLLIILLLEQKEYLEEDYAPLAMKLEPLSNELLQNIAPQHQKTLMQEDAYKFIYFNNMNLAVKLSSKVNALDDTLYRMLASLSFEMQPAAKKSDSLVRSIVKTAVFWVYAVKIIDYREIYVILPPSTLPAHKVEEEIVKFASHYFHNIFTGF